MARRLLWIWLMPSSTSTRLPTARATVALLAAASAIAVAACNKTAPAAHAPVRAEAAEPAAFEPTAFSVAVHGKGRPVILIPGLGCPGAVWDETVAHLSDYQTHVLTLAGFAGQPAIDEPLAKATRDQLAAYVRDRKLESPVIIGHSMGGFIAYWLAASEPELVGPTIIVDSGAAIGSDDPAANASAGAQAREIWKRVGDAERAQRVHDIFGSMAARPARLAPLLDQIAQSDPRAIGEAIYEMYTTDVRPQLPHIRAPVLLVLADGPLGPSFRQQAAGVPDHAVTVVGNAGHFVMLDEPAAFFTAVDTFLSNHPTSLEAQN